MLIFTVNFLFSEDTPLIFKENRQNILKELFRTEGSVPHIWVRNYT